MGKRAVSSLVFGGLLPVIAFTVIEEAYGPLWGVAAGLLFGLGEMIWEFTSTGKISPITLGANGLLLFLGTIAWLASDGIWFKLQPALMEAFFGLALILSSLSGRPLLLLLAEKQGQTIVPAMRDFFSGINIRLGFFFCLHALLATWAALSWSTRAWALLKGAGFTFSLLIYMGLEFLWLRRQLRAQRK